MPEPTDIVTQLVRTETTPTTEPSREEPAMTAPAPTQLPSPSEGWTPLAPSATAPPATGQQPGSTVPQAAPPRRRHGGEVEPAESPGRWYRPAFWGVILAAGLLYLWNLAASGWANSFYAAAVQAGSTSWKALFFGCSDMACSITVDKPPASLWLMSLSAKIFGFSSWSMLVPQALLGAATVGFLMAAVKRWTGPRGAILAGAALALTPVAALMFKFNNPDALLTALLTVAAYCTVRATEKGSTRWLMLAGVAIGFGFLTKMLQAFLVLPALVAVFALAAPVSLRKKIGSLFAALGAVIVSAGWYIAIVELIPASARPYIGGSTDNSILQLTLGYNGLNRITGDATGSMGTGGGMGGGYAGITRLFGTDMGGQISWLLPAALIALAVGIVVTWRRPLTDRRRAGYVLWGGWLLVTGLVFSFMNGIIHAYYTVALAPAVAALAAMGASDLWRRRSLLWARITMAATVAGTALWAWVLLGRSASWQPWLTPVILVAAVAASVGLLLPPTSRVIGRTSAALALVACLLGPAAYTLQTVTTGHTGSMPSAGPSVQGSMGGGPGGQGGPGGNFQGGPGGQNGTGQNGTGQNGQFTGQPPALPGSTGQTNGFSGQSGQTNGQTDGQASSQMPAMPGGQTGGQGDGPGGMGGFLDASQASTEMVTLLQADADQYDWVAATTGSNSAAGLQLSSGFSVMPIGGFNGGDDSPTLAQFQQWVAEGRIHYYVASGGGMGGRGAIDGSNSPSEIQAWVEANFTAQTVDSATVYDLTQPAASAGTATDASSDSSSSDSSASAAATSS